MPLEGCASKKYSTILTYSRNWRAVPPRNPVQYSRFNRHWRAVSLRNTVQYSRVHTPGTVRLFRGPEEGASALGPVLPLVRHGVGAGHPDLIEAGIIVRLCDL